MFDFTLETEALPSGIHVLTASGEIDLFTAPDLREAATAALDAGAQRIVVDLSGVRFLDSTGLGVLIAILKRLRPAGGQFAIVNTNPTTAATFSITGLDDVLRILPTREAALAAVSELPDGEPRHASAPRSSTN
jgi:anti-sigma B factor antagonist